MLRVKKVAIKEIYVPAGRRKTLDPAKAEALAEDILENGQKFRSRFARAKAVSYWSRACIAWRPVFRSVKKKSRPI